MAKNARLHRLKKSLNTLLNSRHYTSRKARRSFATGPWFSGYNISLTWRGSQVRILLGPVNTMKRVFLIHGWGGGPESDWYVWLKKELQGRGFKVYAPQMPDTFHPKIDAWIGFLTGIVKKADKETFFVGHSIGCQAIMRYVESLRSDEKIGGCIFVAGWFHLTDETWDEDYTEEIANPWIKMPINFDKIKKHTNRFIAIQSDNDPYVPVTDAEIFKKELNAKVIMEHNKGHISGQDGVKEVPSILNCLLEISK